MIKKIKAFKNKRLGKQQQQAEQSGEDDSLPLPPPPPPRSNENRSCDNNNDNVNDSDKYKNEILELQTKIKDLEIENRTLTQDMEDQKLAFEARHNSMMAVLQQQTEEHKTKHEKDNEETRHAAKPSPATEDTGLKAKHKTLLVAHEKITEEVIDLKSLLSESRARLDKINNLYEALLESSNVMKNELSDEKTKNNKGAKELNVIKKEYEVMINKSKKIENELIGVKAKYNESKEENNKTILELRENLATIENELLEKKERVIRAEESTNSMTDKINVMEKKITQLEELEKNARIMHEKSQGQTNAAKKKLRQYVKTYQKFSVYAMQKH